MIKESFLRNYSLCKIYSEAEDQKRKLKVFYIRHVQKILREKHMKEREVERDRKNREIKEEREKERQQAQQIVELRRSQRRQVHKMTSKSDEQSQNSKSKAQLRVTNLKFHKNTEKEEHLSPSIRKEWRIKTSLNKSFHKKMMNSFAAANNPSPIFTLNDQIHQNQQEKKYVHALIQTNPTFYETLNPSDKKLRSLHHQESIITKDKNELKQLIGDSSSNFGRKNRIKLIQDQNSFVNQSTMNKVFLAKLKNTGLLDNTKTWVNTPLSPKML